MRWGLLLSLCACGRIGFSAHDARLDAQLDAPHVGYESRRPIVIPHAQLTADLAGLPVMVTMPTDLTGVDFAFLAGDGTPLPFEIDAPYAWVRVPSLSSTADTTIYLAFGDPTVTISQAQPAAVWAGNYVGVWHFSSDLVTDALAANSGTSSGPVSWVPGGRLGGGASFTGMCGQITIAQSPALQPPAVTVSAWARETDLGTSATDRIATIVAQDAYRPPGTGSQGYYLEIYRTLTQPVATFYAANGPAIAHAFSTVNEPNAGWYYSVGTYDPASGTSSIYVDGALQGTQTMTGPIAYVDHPVLMGCNSSGWWIGQIDEVRISNIPRSAAWIAAEYANQSAPDAFAVVGATEPNP